ncbi:MAG TPA: 6-carboxytetrahydropterin synthase [Caldithrix abyssi]|uniref:6-carboxy-5,6,7,8-tetrahydropterin synthase n=1 Tax=Caldithrix abyssi TaxID=187145 RepID=A0A7V5LJ89_CALAY|nr:6-carboxytetrahydropterin synthase [Caldithrix abyssi]
MKKKITISKKFEFSASHRYWIDDWSAEKNNEVFGLCTSPYGHGHNYELHVTVSGPVDPQTGMIINLSTLKAIAGKIVEQFDHKFLNLDTPYFKDRVPTTENIALVLYELLEEQLKKEAGITLEKIRLYERGDLYVDVWPEDK